MGKYRFSLSTEIRGMVRWQLEHYHDDKRQLEQFKLDMIPSPVQGYSETAGCSSGTSRTTENVAERIATNQYVRQTERSCQAIERVLSHLDPIDTQLVDLIYWKRSHTIEGAGISLNLSRTAAYNHVNAILNAIAQELGYVNI